MPLTHLMDLTDGRGVFEHALLAQPRPEHGYCLDDVARAFAVVVRYPNPLERVTELVEIYLSFIENAIAADGLAHNRRDMAGAWTDEPGIGDWWGRAIAGLGAAIQDAEDPSVRMRATIAFRRAAQQRPAAVRTMAFAALGAAAVLHGHPYSTEARALLLDARSLLPHTAVGGWNWPEPRLRYANATLPEALLAVGEALSDPVFVDRGLSFLGFLLDLETHDDHLSVTGHRGRSPGETGPQFDQQAIEVAAMAEACARAFRLTGDERWRTGVRRARAWFEGDNDARTEMIDRENGAGFDGLEPLTRNENRGAESTLAAISTFECAIAIELLPGGSR